MHLAPSTGSLEAQKCKIQQKPDENKAFSVTHGCGTHTHTHTRLTALFPGVPRSVSTRKPIWILLEQETVSGSGISWAICKSAHRSRQITMPAPHHSVFLQAGCPSCRPTNSIKALKAQLMDVAKTETCQKQPHELKELIISFFTHGCGKKLIISSFSS